MADALTFDNELVALWSLLLLPIGLSMITIPLTRRSFIPLVAWTSLAAASALGYHLVPRDITNETFMLLALLYFAALMGAVAAHVVVVGAALGDRVRARRSPPRQWL